MSNKGYAFESETEDFFLRLTGQTKKDPILKTTSDGIIQINRSFRVPGSGAMDSLAGDVVTYLPWLPKQLKVECKTRRQKNKKEGRIFTLELEWVRKNNEEGKADNQIPILTFAFKGDTTGNRTWWLLKSHDWNLLSLNISYPYNILHAECKAHQLSKKGDRLKFIHSLLKLPPDSLKHQTMWSLIFDNQEYYLLSQDQFQNLMVQIRDTKN